MEDLTLPSVGASFKKWRCCIPILPKGLAFSPNFPIFFKEKQKKLKRKGLLSDKAAGGG
jgi:hypothetical protein